MLALSSANAHAMSPMFALSSGHPKPKGMRIACPAGFSHCINACKSKACDEVVPDGDLKDQAFTIGES